MTTQDCSPPGADLVAALLGELRQTVLAEGSRVESVIVDVDIDLDVLLASLPDLDTDLDTDGDAATA